MWGQATPTAPAGRPRATHSKSGVLACAQAADARGRQRPGSITREMVDGHHAIQGVRFWVEEVEQWGEVGHGSIRAAEGREQVDVEPRRLWRPGALFATACRSARSNGGRPVLVDYVLLGLIGFAAQLIDGALGMAFGVIWTHDPAVAAAGRGSGYRVT